VVDYFYANFHFYSAYPGQSLPVRGATALRPLQRVLSSSLNDAFRTRNLRCIDGKLSELLDYSASPPTKVLQIDVEANYGSLERPCCALEDTSSPMYRDGTLNPGGITASSYGGGGKTSKFPTEVFW
jgi:hypothetical protein